MVRKRKEIIFEEADASDAPALLQALEQFGLESEFLVLDEQGPTPDEEQLSVSLTASLENPGKLCLLAKIEDEVIGVINITSSAQTRINHIGDLFMAVRKAYWGHGIGQILLDEAINWAEQSGTIRRLELTVQKRNERAVHLYRKFGFEIEGTKQRGAKTSKGEFLEVYLMGRLID